MPGMRRAACRRARGTSRSRSRAACARARASDPALQRQVDVLADLGRLRDRRDDVVGEVDRVGRREAHALDAVDPRDRAQQLGEPDVLAAVRVHGLAEQLHLPVAGVGQRAHLAQDLARRRAALAPARERHHAERAELVAAALDRDVPDHAARHRARRGRAVVGLLAIEPRVGHRAARRAPRRRDRAAGGSRRGRSPVDVGRALADLVLEVLGHAAGDAEHHVGPRLVCASMLARANTRSSAFSRTAQVLIRIRSAAARDLRARVAAPASRPSTFAVGDVHLAAVGLDVHPPRDDDDATLTRT